MAKKLPRREVLKRGAAGGLVVGTSALAGCRALSGGEDSSTLTLGVLSALELDVGKATVRGTEVAADVINENDTIDQEIEVVSADTSGTATDAVQAYSTLVDREGADITLGLFAESAASTVFSDIVQNEQIHLNVGATSPDLSAQLRDDFESNKYWFRLAPNNSLFFGVDFVNFTERFLVGERDWSRTAIFREDAAWTEEVAPFLKEQFPQIGMEVVDDLVFPLDTSNFSQYFSNLADMDIDCVFGLSAEAGRAPILGYLQSGLQTPMVGDIVAVQSPEFPDDIGSVGEEKEVIGRTHSTWSAQQQTEDSQIVLDRWNEKYDSRPTKPTWAGLGSFAATKVLANAISRAGSTNTDDLIPEIENADYELFQRYQVYGQNEEDPTTGQTFPHDLKFGEDYYQPTWSEWEDGEQVTIWPPDLASE